MGNIGVGWGTNHSNSWYIKTLPEERNERREEVTNVQFAFYSYISCVTFSPEYYSPEYYTTNITDMDRPCVT